jgi:NodT family efflux transporter outer membrane factor (OMF) lipoprotein
MKRSVALALAILLTGCATGPRYVRPTVEVPASYKEGGHVPGAPAPGWAVAEPGDAQPRGAWWEIFHERELNSLEKRIDVSNQTVRQAVATLEQARAIAGQARALYFPTVDAAAGVQPNHTSANVSGSLAGKTVTDYSAGLTASWEPDLFDKIGHAATAATARAQASAADLAAVELSMHGELAVEYFDLRQVDSQAALLRGTVHAYDQALTMVRQRYDMGVASQYELAQAQTQLQTARAQLIDLGVSRAALEDAIAALIGVPAADFSLPLAPAQPAPPKIPVGVPSELLERRPDVAAAERRVAASNADVGSAVSAFFPDVLLSATRGFESYSIGNWLTLPSRFWAVGPQIVGTLFDGGMRHERLKQAEASYQASVAAYRQVALSSFQEVEDNLAALRVLASEAQVQQAAVTDSQHALDLSLNLYRGGATDYLSVITAQTIALSNERQATAIAGRRLDASVLLIEALGGLWATDPSRSAGPVGNSLSSKEASSPRPSASGLFRP